MRKPTVNIYCTFTVLLASFMGAYAAVAAPLELVVANNSFSIKESHGGKQWFASGGTSIHNNALSPCNPSQTSTGKDALGTFTRTTSSWCNNTSDATPVLSTSIRIYSHDDQEEQILVAVFEQTFPQGLPHSLAEPTPTLTSAPTFTGQTDVASAFPTLVAGSNAPPLNAFTYWGPSGMFTELTRYENSYSFST